MKEHKIIKNIISKDLCNFLHEYLISKKEILKTLRETKYISPFSSIHGELNGDPQVPGSFCIYGDAALDLILLKIMPIIEKTLKTKLSPTYSYARIYKKGDVLKKHVDRESCAISGTLNLGGDLWPIYLKDNYKKTHEVILNSGDILLYDGCNFEHWREQFNKELCTQVFLHYNNKNSKNIYDNRKHLGLPINIKA
jgi:hypothetical protein